MFEWPLPAASLPPQRPFVLMWSSGIVGRHAWTTWWSYGVRSTERKEERRDGVYICIYVCEECLKERAVFHINSNYAWVVTLWCCSSWRLQMFSCQGMFYYGCQFNMFIKCACVNGPTFDLLKTQLQSRSTSKDFQECILCIFFIWGLFSPYIVIQSLKG